MANKLITIKELSEQTLQSLSVSSENWTGFLRSAARLYKYPFHEQILIHAQRPDATACASFDLWNNRMKRYVNKGATGIALLDDSGQRPYLRYVFDVSDTNSRESTPFHLWEMREDDQAVVLEELSNHFGAEKGFDDLPFQFQLHGIVSNAIADNITDYANILFEQREGSNFEELDENDIVAELSQALVYSVGYICMTRTVEDANAFYSELSIEYPISRFNTPQMVSCLGQAVSDISEMVLRQIERTVRENQRVEPEKFAQSKVIGETIEKSIERGEQDEQLSIHAGGRLSDSQPDFESAAGSRDRQIWEDAQKLLAGAETGDLQPHATDGDASPAPVGDRPDDET